MSWFSDLGLAFLGTLRDVLPIGVVVLVFQLLVIRKPLPHAGRMAIGFAYVVVGLSLFVVGLDRALFPVGRLMAEQLTAPGFLGIAEGDVGAWWRYGWVYAFGFALGFGTAIAEPSLLAVAIKASAVSGGAVSQWGLRIAVALGVATGVALGSFRIVMDHSLPAYVIAAYVLVIALTLAAPRLLVPLAYDSGGVATSTVSVPLMAALGLGLAESLPGRSPLMDGFGMIALACLFPIISVMVYALVVQSLVKRAHRAKAATQPKET